MNEWERHTIISEAYADLVVEYNNNLQFFERYHEYTYNLINENYAVVHIPVKDFNENAVQEFGYHILPKCFGLTAFLTGRAEGVSAHSVNTSENSGAGIVIGIIDTGIDYRNQIFIREDNTTKIELIWDQTIVSNNYPQNFYYGTEYTAAEINRALASNNPLDIVPSIDLVGEGTAMAGVATGLSDNIIDVLGVVPGASLAVVKLKQAKSYLMDFYGIPKDEVCFQQNDLMMGIEYLIRASERLQKPVVICLGLSSSQGSHKGEDIICNYINENTNKPGICILLASGNEGDQSHHYFRLLTPPFNSDTVYLNVGKEDKNFTAEMWGVLPSLLNVRLIAPNGEIIYDLKSDFASQRNISIMYHDMVVFIDSYNSEAYSEQQLIMFRFRNMTDGVWQFIVSGTDNLETEFHMWLPIRNFISEETFFYNADPYTTISGPGNADFPITISAYEPVNITLAPFTGRGFTSMNLPKPTITAPGINLLAPTLHNTIIPISGTCLAVAYAAGICAGLLQEGLSQNDSRFVTTAAIKNSLMINAVRRRDMKYPNRDWGYGYIQ